MGRPKEFCVDGALAKALEMFWRHGFEGTSLTDLTEAMGITRPSLYAAYGNKEELFRKALDLYDREYLGFMRDALLQGSAREVAGMILDGFARLATDHDHPRGCLGTSGALTCSAAADPIKDELLRRRRVFETALCHRLQEACTTGDLPDDENPADLAHFIMTVANGIAVQGTSGASRTSLERAARLALRGWPGQPSCV